MDLYLLLLVFMVVAGVGGQLCEDGAIKVNNEGNEFTFVPLPYEKCTKNAGNFAVCGSCSNDINTTGWSTLKVTSYANYPDEVQAYAAGYFEGFATQHLIWLQYQNIYADLWGKNDSSFTPVLEWLKTQYAWEQSQVTNQTLDWQQVNLTRLQQQGMTAGYIAAAPSSEMLSEDELFMLASIGDVGTSILYYIDFGERYERKPILDIFLGSHCTGIIKVTDEDIIAGETMWEDYAMMLRIFKYYDLNFNSVLVQSSNMAFSGYPGVLVSLDDFWRTDTDLIVMETEITVLNKSVLSYISPYGILGWQRLLIANRVADNPEDWATIMSTHSTGTFTVSWMVLSLKNEPKNGVLPLNSFWVVEETPGITFSGDATEFLNNQTYYASYNFPYFKDAWNYLGFQLAAEVFNMTYDDNPRANVIRREAPGVVDIETMQVLIRYNDWQSDPEQMGAPGWGVCSRNDLPVYNCSALLCNPNCHGGLDGKVTSRESNTIYAISGPTAQNQPVFVWSESTVCAGILHEGHPDAWDFDWQLFSM